jgi:hypothetical protein
MNVADGWIVGAAVGVIEDEDTHAAIKTKIRKQKQVRFMKVSLC